MEEATLDVSDSSSQGVLGFDKASICWCKARASASWKSMATLSLTCANKLSSFLHSLIPP